MHRARAGLLTCLAVALLAAPAAAAAHHDRRARSRTATGTTCSSMRPARTTCCSVRRSRTKAASRRRAGEDLRLGPTTR